MRYALILLTAALAAFLVTSHVDAGSFTGTWPNIGSNNTKAALDAVSCVTMPLTRTDQDHSCREVPSFNTSSTNAYAAECRFVMALTGNKTVWRIDGTYDSSQVFSGSVIQTLPTCSGFLCQYIGQVQWMGRSPLPVKEYYYYWNATGGQGGCEVAKINNVIKGTYYGSY